MATTKKALISAEDSYRELRIESRPMRVDGTGIGRWRHYYTAESMREARSVMRYLNPSAQVRLKHSGVVVVRPQRNQDFLS